MKIPISDPHDHSDVPLMMDLEEVLEHRFVVRAPNGKDLVNLSVRQAIVIAMSRRSRLTVVDLSPQIHHGNG